MASSGFFDGAIERRLLDLHCGYIGKVVWTDGSTATVQPLGMIKAYGQNASPQAIVSDVPVACKYRISTASITYATGSGNETETTTVAVPELIKSGDLVACLCADRDITAARRGQNDIPAAGDHRISDSIIVGIL